MAELVKYIFLFLIGTTILNLMIAVVARVKTQSKEFNNLIYYWLALFMTYFATAALSKSPKEIAFSFFFQMIPASIGIHIIRSSTNLRDVWKTYFFTLLGTSVASAYLILKTDVGFTLSLLPITLGINFLLIDTSWGILVTKKKEVNWVEKGMAYLLISSVVNNMNFMFFRLDEATAWWGWSVSIAQYQGLSIFLPLLINHKRQENERKGLENALEKLSGKASIPQNLRIEELYEALEFQIGQKELFSNRLELTNEVLSEEQEVNRILMKAISHDLANPLTVVSAYLDMIRTGRIAQDDYAKILERMKQNITSANDMIGRIRKAIYHRTEAELVRIAPIDVEFAITRVLSNFDERLRAKNLKVKQTTSTSDFSSLADENALVEHVLSNILSNAIKFSFEGQEIHITVSGTASTLTIEIRDFGIGINPERNRNAALLSTPGTNGEVGTGFGLIIMGYFMRKFSGIIEIISHREKGENGTSVVITLGRPVNTVKQNHLVPEAANIFS